MRVTCSILLLIVGALPACGFESSSGLLASDAPGPCGKAFVLGGEAVNARDLGGTPLADGATVACGHVYRGGELARLGASGCADFAELGIRTVVDLRTLAESSVAPEPSCVTEQATLVKAPLPTPYSVSREDYLADLDTTASVVAALSALGDDTAYPVYFHCVYGRDRTGVLSALVLLALGASRQDVIVEYQRSGLVGLATFADSLAAVLDRIEQAGGIDAYLALIGVPAATLSTLRARVTMSAVVEPPTTP